MILRSTVDSSLNKCETETIQKKKHKKNIKNIADQILKNCLRLDYNVDLMMVWWWCNCVLILYLSDKRFHSLTGLHWLYQKQNPPNDPYTVLTGLALIWKSNFQEKIHIHKRSQNRNLKIHQRNHPLENDSLIVLLYYLLRTPPPFGDSHERYLRSNGKNRDA